MLDITIEHINKYLSEVKEAIRDDRYRIDRNQNRQENIDLFLNYILDENKAKEILLSLTATDFSGILQNEHKGYEHELLYLFAKTIKLRKRIEDGEKDVSLYIKINKLGNGFVIVISFHEQNFPLSYYFG